MLDTSYVIAVLGIPRLLKPLNILKRDIRAATELPTKIEDGLRDFIEGKQLLITSSISMADAQELQNAIVDIDAEELLKYAVRSLEDAGMPGVEIMNDMAHIFQQLQEQLALNDSMSALARMVWALRVLDNPLWVLRLMSDQQLTKFDVNVLQSAYPAIYKQISDLLIQNLVDTMDPKKAVPRRIKQMSAIFLGLPTVSPEILAAYEDRPEPKPQDIDLTAGA